MKYNQPHGVADANAAYVNGNPATGVNGSIPPAAALEAPQREIVAAILGSGQTPSPDDSGQLWQAIQRVGMFRYGVATGTASAITVATTTPATTAIPNGYTVAIKIAHAVVGTGTEQTTISVAGSTPARATRPDGTNLYTGDLLVGQIAVFTFDGTKWQMVSPNAASFSGGGGGGGGGGDGADGAAGSQIYNGEDDPGGVLGVDGDYFLNTASFDLFRRISGGWTLLCNLKGSDGQDAATPSAVTLTTTTTLTTDKFDYEVKLSAAGTFTTTLPTPVAYGGVGRFHIYNAASVAMTLATPAGSFVGPHGSGGASLSLPAGATAFVISDGTNWVVASIGRVAPEWCGIGFEAIVLHRSPGIGNNWGQMANNTIVAGSTIKLYANNGGNTWPVDGSLSGTWRVDCFAGALNWSGDAADISFYPLYKATRIA